MFCEPKRICQLHHCMTAPLIRNFMYYSSAEICSSSICRIKTQCLSSLLWYKVRKNGWKIFFWYICRINIDHVIYIAITRHNDFGSKKRNENGKERKRRETKRSIKNKGKKSSHTHLCWESMYIYNLYLRIRMRCARNVKFL